MMASTRISPQRIVLRRWSAMAAIIAAGLAVSACGKSERAPTILNTEKVEHAIEQSISEQRGKNARVSCPSGVHQKKGLEFVCTAVVKRASTRFVVTQRDGAGQVHYEAR